MVSRTIKKEVNAVAVLRHWTVKEVVDLLRLGHRVYQGSGCYCVLVRFNVVQGPMRVASPKVLEGSLGFVCQEVEVWYVLSMGEDGQH